MIPEEHNDQWPAGGGGNRNLSDVSIKGEEAVSFHQVS